MAELTRFERVISGTGSIRIPDEYRNARDVYLYIDEVRKPHNEYLNVSWRPPRGFYANVTFCVDDHVWRDFAVDFKSQVFLIYSGQASQNLLSLICALDNVLDSFVNFAAQLLFFYTKNNSIKSHGYETFIPNNIRFRCYSNAALRLVLTGNELDRCNPADGTPTPPPPPPPPPTPVPTDEAVEVSPPYEDDDELTYEPFPTDEEPDGGDQIICGLYLVTLRIIQPGGGSFAAPYYARGVVEDARIFLPGDGSEQIQIFARGASDTISVECGEPGWVTVGGASGGGQYDFASIENIEFVPE